MTDRSRETAILAAIRAAGVALPACVILDRMVADARPIPEIVADWRADPRCVALTNAYRALERGADSTASRMVMSRARHYRKHPAGLEIFAPRLASASGASLIAWGEHFLEMERNELPRWYGFGGEVTAINAKAIVLLGRWRRRFEDREQARAA